MTKENKKKLKKEYQSKKAREESEAGAKELQKIYEDKGIPVNHGFVK